jgi:Fe-S cluster assembly protein SufD
VSASLNSRIAEDFAAATGRPAATGTPSSSGTAAAARTARRRAALERLLATGLPGSRDENWKYANLRPLERLRFVPATAQPAPLPADLPPALEGFARYVFMDGVPAADTPATTQASAALVTLGDGGDDSLSGAAERPAGAAAGDERFALLNQAFATAQVAIEVPAAAGEPARLELLFVASADAQAGASYPRVSVRVDRDARLVVLERHVSAAAAPGFVNSAVTVDLARGAHFEHYRLQELNTRTILFDTLSAQVAQDATYRLHAISTGGQSARSTMTVRLTGERAGLALAAVALGDRQQVQDAFAVVEHAAPNARTTQTFRGIAAGRSRVAFNGKIVVAHGAHGTDSQQSLRGLLAGPEAEIDVRPQLEIYTDDVRCSHGATAGKLDDNMLFYLLSRGLDRDTAQRLLKWAFLEDVIAQIASPVLRRQIETRLAAHLRDETLQELL